MTDANLTQPTTGVCEGCEEKRKLVDHLCAKCRSEDRMLGERARDLIDGGYEDWYGVPK